MTDSSTICPICQEDLGAPDGSPVFRAHYYHCIRDAKTPAHIRAHTHCGPGHRDELLQSGVAGCFYCLKTFSPLKIKEWTDRGQTAICPKCGIDSVIGDRSGFQITKEFLSQMYDHWFQAKFHE